MQATIRSHIRVGILCALVIVGLALWITPRLVHAAGTTYYINNLSGSHCSNSNAGTVSTAPWCDFTNVNSHTFGPDDTILLARGATWNQRMDLYGSGSAGNLITLGAYGTGALPHIRRNDQPADRAIWLHDPSYWNLNDLEVSDAGAGIVAYYTTNLHETLQFNDIYTHDIKGVFAGSPAQTDLPGMYHSVGILITGNVPVTTADYAVQNVTATNLLGYNNNDDFDISGFNANSSGQQGFLSEALGHHSVQNVVLKNSYFHGGQSGENFDNLQHLTIIDTRIDDMGHGANSAGTTALFFWDSADVTFANSLLTNEANTNSNDQSGSDLEKDNDSIHFRSDYIAGNAGVGVEILQNSETNIEVTDTAFTNNGAFSTNAGGTTGPLWHNNFSNASGSANGAITNNLSAETKPFTIGDFSTFTLSNNQAVDTSTNLYNAASQFSSTQGQNQWRYQYFYNNVWQDISPYDSTNQRWGGNGYVSTFDILPDTCTACWIARDWVAPTAGTISIRGRALKNDTGGGDGVQVRITKNGAQIWPGSSAPQSLTSNDQVGVSTDLDNLTVAAGDSIRFEVNNGGKGNASHDVVSWAPSVAYITALGGTRQWVNNYTSKCLGFAGNSSTNGAFADEWDCTAGNSQYWSLSQQSNGTYQMVNSYTSKCLGFAGNSSTNGTFADEWDCTAGNSQYWQILVQPDGTYQLKNNYTGKCLGFTDNSSTNGTNADEWDCTAGNSQYWKFQ
jgi:Ricin-type beta-trefoil lectin domain-like